MESTKSLDGNHTPRGDRVCYGGDHIVAIENGTVRPDERNSRAAERTCVRLRVKSSIADTPVLVFASLAHPEPCHCRCRPVVRHVARNRKTGAAVRAVDEWIPVTSICRIEQLRNTCGTCGQVGWYGYPSLGALFTLKDVERIDRCRPNR